VFICWEGLVFNCLNKITSCRNNTANKKLYNSV
jgi:hypothetical protein